MKLIDILLETNTELKEVKPKTSYLGSIRNKFLDDAIEKVLKFDPGNPIKVKDGATGNMIAVKTADELYNVIHLLNSKELGKLYKGLLKNPTTPDGVISHLVKDIVDDDKFVKMFAQYTDDKILKSELKKYQFSDKTVKEILKQKNTGKFGQTRSANISGGKGGSGGSTSTSSGKGGFGKFGDLLSGLRAGWTWKKSLAWATALGIGGGALWYWMTQYAGDSLPPDMPQVPPSDYAPCVQNLLDTGKGSIYTSPQGQVSVRVVDEGYPLGVLIYSNGQIRDLSTRRMGRWTCVEGQVQATNENKKRLSLMSLLEQSNEVTTDQMTKFLRTAVMDLDGWVGVDNINSLINIVNSLKGKTYNGQDAFEYFLGVYLEDEGENFIDDVNSVGVQTLGLPGIEGKRKLLALINSSPAQVSSGGLSDLNIVWDGGSGSSSGGSSGTSSGMRYFSCEDWDLRTKPYILGCKATRISEVQSCLGLKPDGMFGPKTEKALKDIEADVSNGITAQIYNRVMKACGRPELDMGTPTTGSTETPTTTEPSPSGETQTAGSTETPTATATSPISEPTTSTTGRDIYMRLVENGLLTSSRKNRKFRYKGDILSQDDLFKLTQFIKSIYGLDLTNVREAGDENYRYIWKQLVRQ